MQITSGWAKGLRLATPAGDAVTRPTSAKVRAATLNTLLPYLEGSNFLDVFAGSGAMGIEAVSRGARGAVFVELGKEPLRCLKANLDELRRRAASQKLAAPSLEVVAGDAAEALARLAKSGLGPFDLIFVDPPYREAGAWLEKLMPLLALLVTEEGLVVFESSSAAAGQDPAWEVLKQKSYGDTMITIYSRRNSGGT